MCMGWQFSGSDGACWGWCACKSRPLSLHLRSQEQSVPAVARNSLRGLRPLTLRWVVLEQQVPMLLPQDCPQALSMMQLMCICITHISAHQCCLVQLWLNDIHEYGQCCSTSLTSMHAERWSQRWVLQQAQPAIS